MLSFYYHKKPYKSIMFQDVAVSLLVGHLEVPSCVTDLKGAVLLPSSISAPAWQKQKPASIKNKNHWKNCAVITKTRKEAEGV